MNTTARNQPEPLDTKKFNPEEVFQAGLLNHHIANTAYPIAHVLTTKPYRIWNTHKNEFVKHIRDWIDEVWLYAHVPFCERICNFCEYTVVDPKQYHNANTHDVYFDALRKEFEMYATQTELQWKKLSGFDIGWWTPSVVDQKYIWQLVDLAHKHFTVPENMSISIETTPKIAAGFWDKIKAYHDMWINRISMGVQDISPKVLESVWRTVTSLDRNKQATDNIRTAWFDSFNIDIMYGLVNQNVERVKATLAHVIDLDPEHITIYRTRYKGTKMQDKWYLLELQNIQEQYQLIKAMLKEAWYNAWMGKNTFSRVPWSSGASEYLTNRVVKWTPYVWMWLGAQSYNIKSLYYNQWAWSKKIHNYLQYINEKQKFPLQDIYHLSKEMSAWKFASVSFYFGWIDLASFQEHFDCTIEEMFSKEVQFLTSNWYMQYEDGRLQLTELGNQYYNWVISMFYAWSVKQVLLDRVYQLHHENAQVC